ncbi:antitermination protein [Salmonella enterica subsp. enterica serovar Havana]|nr:antitermination protein [Salmonella enterica subsp. enterica serovar Havana]EDV6710932.1 antitermination protein [Salmonella enterica subsp. enterica serovar Havana]
MTRRTAFNGSASGRRRERRAALQNAVTASSEVMHRPTLSRAQIQAQGKHETPKRIEDAKPIKFMVQDAFWQLEEYKRNLERAAIVYANEFGHKPMDTGMCLPDVALYAAGYRNVKPVTAR